MIWHFNITLEADNEEEAIEELAQRIAVAAEDDEENNFHPEQHGTWWHDE